MKKTKHCFLSLCLILLCFSLLSCQALSQKPETETEKDIQFAESNTAEPLFKTMSSKNYFDVTDFAIYAVDDNNASKKSTPVVCFSYIPNVFELRLFDNATMFRHSNETFPDLSIETDETLACLEGLSNIKPLRVLKPESDQSDAVLSNFSKQFGIAYTFRFIHNVERNTADISIPKQTASYDFLISRLTESDTYYVCDKSTLTVFEVAKEDLAFLEKAPEDWYDTSIYKTHIGFVHRIEIDIKNGTTAGVCGVTNVILEHRNTDQNGTVLRPREVIAAGPEAILQVTARYKAEPTVISHTLKYRQFYAGILKATLQEVVSDASRQEQLKNETPEMILRMVLRCDGQQKTLEYRFFADNSVLINDVYVGKLTDGQISVLISNVGIMLSPDTTEKDLIDLWNPI